MDDGTEETFGPGDAAVILPGHNAWVIGNPKLITLLGFLPPSDTDTGLS